MKRVLLIRETVLVLAAILLLLPLLGRAYQGDPLIPFPQSYDYLADGGGSLYRLCIEFLAPLGDSRVFISVLLGLLTLFLLDRLLGKRLDTDERVLSLVVILVNPLFLSLFTGLSPMTIALPVMLFALLLFDNGVLAPIPVLGLILYLLSPVSMIVLLAALFIIGQTPRQRRVILLSFVGLISLAVLLFLADKTSFLETLSAPPSVHVLFAEFGGSQGLSLFFLILALIEGVLRWVQGRFRAGLIALVTLLVASVFVLDAIILAGIIVGPLCALFLIRQANRKWRLEEARFLTLLVIGCSLLFLLLTHVVTIIGEQPSQDMVRTLDSLPADEGLVLASPALASVVKHFSGHPMAVNVDTQELYATYRAAAAADILDGSGVAYLFLTREMWEGSVWNREDEGFLLLLRNSPQFELISQSEDAQLWRYLPALDHVADSERS